MEGEEVKPAAGARRKRLVAAAVAVVLVTAGVIAALALRDTAAGAPAPALADAIPYDGRSPSRRARAGRG